MKQEGARSLFWNIMGTEENYQICSVAFNINFQEEESRCDTYHHKHEAHPGSPY